MPSRKHVLATCIEHKSVLGHSAGFVRSASRSSSCRSPLAVMSNLMPFVAGCAGTLSLVSMMHANNETGVLQPVIEICWLVGRIRGVISH